MHSRWRRSGSSSPSSTSVRPRRSSRRWRPRKMSGSGRQRRRKSSSSPNRGRCRRHLSEEERRPRISSSVKKRHGVRVSGRSERRSPQRRPCRKRRRRRGGRRGGRRRRRGRLPRRSAARRRPRGSRGRMRPRRRGWMLRRDSSRPSGRTRRPSRCATPMPPWPPLRRPCGRPSSIWQARGWAPACLVLGVAPLQLVQSQQRSRTGVAECLARAWWARRPTAALLPPMGARYRAARASRATVGATPPAPLAAYRRCPLCHGRRRPRCRRCPAPRPWAPPKAGAPALRQRLLQRGARGAAGTPAAAAAVGGDRRGPCDSHPVGKIGALSAL
mmetsp:Transcript_155221/g.497868  ORF Transcript_155221/g.497868 Transcript_155221/m.497868 type:complete len:330 (-) Transcript_155221:73-1062(-)